MGQSKAADLDADARKSHAQKAKKIRAMMARTDDALKRTETQLAAIRSDASRPNGRLNGDVNEWLMRYEEQKSEYEAQRLTTLVHLDLLLAASTPRCLFPEDPPEIARIIGHRQLPGASGKVVMYKVKLARQQGAEAVWLPSEHVKCPDLIAAYFNHSSTQLPRMTGASTSLSSSTTSVVAAPSLACSPAVPAPPISSDTMAPVMVGDDANPITSPSDDGARPCIAAERQDRASYHATPTGRHSNRSHPYAVGQPAITKDHEDGDGYLDQGNFDYFDCSQRCTNCRGFGHTTCRLNNGSNRKCYNCGGWNHMGAECPAPFRSPSCPLPTRDA